MNYKEAEDIQHCNFFFHIRRHTVILMNVPSAEKDVLTKATNVLTRRGGRQKKWSGMKNPTVQRGFYTNVIFKQEPEIMQACVYSQLTMLGERRSFL